MFERPVTGTAAEIGQYVNVATAKKIAFVLMIAFSAYHGYIMSTTGKHLAKYGNKCSTNSLNE